MTFCMLTDSNKRAKKGACECTSVLYQRIKLFRVKSICHIILSHWMRPNINKLQSMSNLMRCVDVTTTWFQNFNVRFKWTWILWWLRNILGRNDFSDQFRKITIRYEGTGYNMNIMWQTTYFAVNPITVNNFAVLFNCTPAGRASDSGLKTLC